MSTYFHMFFFLDLVENLVNIEMLVHVLFPGLMIVVIRITCLLTKKQGYNWQGKTKRKLLVSQSGLWVKPYADYSRGIWKFIYLLVPYQVSLFHPRENQKPVFSNCSTLMKRFFENLHFRYASVVWTVGATGEFKLRLKIRDSVDAICKVVVRPSISFRFCLTHEVPDSNEVYLPFV